MKLGTYTTFDTPVKNQDNAFDYLSKCFAPLNARVKRVMNPHDLGSYPSFEIDYPEHLEYISDDDCDCCVEGCAKCDPILERDQFHDLADKIYNTYNKKFMQ